MINWVEINLHPKTQLEFYAEKQLACVSLKVATKDFFRYSEFNSSKLIANTIIPWTVEWLYYYELWLATGEWLGGGEHLTKCEINTS